MVLLIVFLLIAFNILNAYLICFAYLYYVILSGRVVVVKCQLSNFSATLYIMARI